MVCMALQVTVLLVFSCFPAHEFCWPAVKKKTAAETVINHNERKQMKPKASAASESKDDLIEHQWPPNLLLVSKNAFSAAILYTVKSNGAFNYALKSCLYFKQLVIRYIKEI